MKIYHGARDEVMINTVQENQRMLAPAHKTLAMMGMAKLRDAEMLPAQGHNILPAKHFISMAHKIPDDKTLKDRVAALNERNQKRPGDKRKIDKGGALADDFEAEDNMMELEDENEDADENMLALEDAPDEHGRKMQRTNKSKDTTSPAGKAGTMKKSMSLDGLVAPNPHEMGTYDYWYYELRFELAFDCLNIAHPLNQARILSPKLSDLQRSSLDGRVALCEKAKSVNYKNVGNLKDPELKEVWFDLSRAGAKATSKLKISLWERYTKNTKQKLEATADIKEKGIITRPLLAKAAMWKKQDGDEELVIVTHPGLNTLGLGDSVTAKLFTDTIYGTVVHGILLKNQGGIPDLYMFFEAAAI